MSSRTVPRFALTGLLVAALGAPAAAQGPRAAAPMPRATGDVRSIHTYEVAPMPRERSAVAPAPRTVVIGGSFGVFGGPSQTWGVAVEAPLPMNRPTATEVPVPPMAPPVAPAPSGCCSAPSPAACQGCEVRMPHSGAFAIGAGGLQRLMPRPDAPQFFLPPAPVPAGSFVIEIDEATLPAKYASGPVVVKQTQAGSFVVGVCGIGQAPPTAVPACAPSAPHASPVAYEVPLPRPLPVAAHPSSGAPLNGTWYRDAGVGLIVVSFAGDEMTVRVTQHEDGKTVTFTFTAHCTVTRDGLVYGAITSGDVDLKGESKSETAVGMELAELSLLFQELTDLPFSFRTKVTPAGLMVSHLKTPIEGGDKKELMILGGLYKRAKDGKVPEPTPFKTTGASGVILNQYSSDPNVRMQPPRPPAGASVGPLTSAATCPQAVERIGIDFNSPPPMSRPAAPVCVPLPPPMVPPAAPVPTTLMPGSVRPVCCPGPTDAMKEMAKNAFFQMVGDTWYGGMTLPSPRYLEHYPQYFAPDPAFPLPRELAAQEDPAGAARRASGPLPSDWCATGTVRPTAANGLPGTPTLPAPAAKPGPIGTWVREVGSKRCVVKVAAGHFTATVSEAQELGGKTATGHLTFTVDYHLARDGMTAVGLITSVDVKFDGELPDEEAAQMMQRVGEIQKALEDTPVALTFRPYGDTLVIGSVRMSSVGNLLESEPSAYIGGRYRAAGDKPLPALKAIKASEPKPLPVYGPPVPCPAGAYGPPLPPGLAYPPLGAPAGDQIPPQQLGRPVPAPTVALPPLPVVESVQPPPTVRPAEAVTIPKPLPTMTAPVEPAPVMPAPVEPTASAEPEARPVADIAVTWDKKLASLPDPTRSGELTTCIVGQLFVYEANHKFAKAGGTLVVELTDETPRPAGQRPATSERWVLDKEALKKTLAKNDTFGEYYALILPWLGDHSDVTRVKLVGHYVAEGGQKVYVPPSAVTLATAPRMAQPAAPASEKTEPAKAAPDEKEPGEPNARIQHRDGWEDFRKIQKEWRRFWSDYQPGRTPERIHGGIY